MSRRTATPAGEPAGVAPSRLPGVDADQVLAFRLARSGLAARDARGLAEAAACPASDFARDAALLALAARADGVTREDYDRAVDAGDLVVAHVVRGAIHALAPGDFALYGRALVARDDDELAAQLGRQMKRLAAEKGFAPTAALGEVADATKDALAKEDPLDKTALHQALRERVGADLMPWCRGCGSHHVAPMLWRYATVRAGVRLDAGAATRRASPAAHRARARRSVASCASTGRRRPASFADGPGLPSRTRGACGTRSNPTSRRRAMRGSCPRTPACSRRRRPRRGSA